MAIYPDKKDGKLTGRFRVELQKGGQRYRKRWDSYKEAEADETAVLAAWGRGEEIFGAEKAAGSPDVWTFANVIPLAKGLLWEGAEGEDTNWTHLDTISSILGANTRLDAVDTHSVDRVIVALQKRKLADGTINRYLSHLSKFLSWAKDRKYRSVPMDETKFAWRKESTGRIRWITADEEKALHAHWAKDGSDVSLRVSKLVGIAIRTGCRRGELLPLDKDQIGTGQGHRLHLWETKSDAPRTVPMDEQDAKDLLWLIETGMPTVAQLRRSWTKARKALGLEHDEDFVFHACRHTCATRLVDAGVNIFVIKEWMGHKCIETTLRYAHVKPQNLEDALVRVGEHRLKLIENPQFSAPAALPLTPPIGGATGPNAAQYAAAA